MSNATRITIGLLVGVTLGALGLIAWLLLTVDTLDVAEPDPEEEEEPAIAPLTGAEVDEPLEHPVLATKVSNIGEARPQHGLAGADVVYEVLTEGGITRFVALYHSARPDEVGPIRSAREIDVDLLPPYDPILAVSGGRDEVMTEARRLLEVVTEGPGFYRADDRPAPHDLYLRPDEILDLVETPPAPPTEPVRRFAVEVPDGGTPTSELAVEMSPRATTGWVYDEDEALYRRLQDGRAHELVDGEIGAANVVVLGVEITPRNELVDIGMIGEGDAVVLRDGQRYDVRWEKPARGEQITLVRDDREDLPLRPGPTWFVVAPEENLPTPAGP